VCTARCWHWGLPGSKAGPLPVPRTLPGVSKPVLNVRISIPLRALHRNRILHPSSPAFADAAFCILSDKNLARGGCRWLARGQKAIPRHPSKPRHAGNTREHPPATPQPKNQPSGSPNANRETLLALGDPVCTANLNNTIYFPVCLSRLRSQTQPRSEGLPRRQRRQTPAARNCTAHFSFGGNSSRSPPSTRRGAPG